jgi:hypothetical protein
MKFHTYSSGRKELFYAYVNEQHNHHLAETSLGSVVDAIGGDINYIAQELANYLRTTRMATKIITIQLLENSRIFWFERPRSIGDRRRQTNKRIRNGLLIEAHSPHSFLARYCETCLSENGLLLEFVERQSEAACLSAVKNNGLALKFARDKTRRVIEQAIANNGLSIAFICADNAHLKPFSRDIGLPDLVWDLYNCADITESELSTLLETLIQRRRPLLHYHGPHLGCKDFAWTPYQGREIVYYRGNLSIWNGCTDNEPYQRIDPARDDRFDYCRLAVQQNGLAIQYIGGPCAELEEIAIRQNPMALELIQRPSHQLIELAVKLCGLSLKGVGHQTFKLCVKAVKNRPEALQHVNGISCLHVTKRIGDYTKTERELSIERERSERSGRKPLSQHELSSLIRLAIKVYRQRREVGEHLSDDECLAQLLKNRHKCQDCPTIDLDGKKRENGKFVGLLRKIGSLVGKRDSRYLPL